MTRRAVLVAAAAVALILAPTAAMASTPSMTYAAVVVSRPMADPTPGAGVPFKVRAAGATSNEAVTLTITRSPASTGSPRVMTKNANAGGVVEFEVTLTQDGTYALVSTDVTGSVLGRQSVTVVDQGSVIVAGEGASAAAGGAAAGSGAGGGSEAAGTVAGSRLGYSGFQGMGLAVAGGLLVLAGSGLVLLAGFPRRRKPESGSPGAGRRSGEQAPSPA